MNAIHERLMEAGISSCSQAILSSGDPAARAARHQESP